ncbi:hypothetical protein D3C76_1761020 [compost metagenome]
MLATCADASALAQVTGFTPRISLDEGLRRFVAWFQEYYSHTALEANRAGEQSDQRRAV